MIATAESLLAGARKGDRPRRPRRAVVAAVAATTGLAIIATVIGIASLGSPSRPAVDVAAVRLLAKVAAAAGRQSAPHVRDSQYMYIETKEAVSSVVLKPLGLGSVPPHPSRHIHLKLITSRVWVPVANSCGPVYKRSVSAHGKTTIQTFSGVKCGTIGSLNDPTYRLLQTLPPTRTPCSR